ncbi:cytoplasmic tRNA 2-thiolation protein 2 [Aaosphaeria arxii CBS 175.79]|uniref:Cytoplasmic tRNA 2-thiolation protein 2 n=1 Tax=Aaosphaeria arxii CBS 175.79 TaxID=1450172 RepID=A0A6A5X699_9PLEO|nr:cytoplasmic tRNA 2-thiolation protein 2 [Aaosphaeria arxii CBS 175.79]KAF2008386.1 cytoplasmic tRNA 2-thiolation protein 2 [Aaosphaeria arxii CBS 175.79]
MPGKHVEGIAEKACRRCKDNSAVLVVRLEPLCRDCFNRYVQTKAIKRMETFRVRNSAPDQQRKILLPVSFGVSSVSLLHILDTHLKTQQAKTGRTGYSLVVFFVDTSSIDEKSPNPELLKRLQESYPDHTYVSVALQDLVAHIPPGDPLLELVPALGLENTPTLERFSTLVNSLTSATARADVLSTLRTRLIVERAKLAGCEGILWGDSTTKLAEKTLSETAKGRGFSLPWQILDGESPFGIGFHYPLRDVLKKELASYVELSDPSLSTFVHEGSTLATQASMSSKNTTIDDLMKQYFESVEENFPSIVANVVRTTGKLEASEVAQSDPRCSLCKMPVVQGRFGIHGWGGDQQDGLLPAGADTATGLCYGCTRSMPRSTVVSNGSS